MTGALEQVQIDHTVVDLIVVDERHRLPISVSGKCRKAKRTPSLSRLSTRSISRNACREYGHS